MTAIQEHPGEPGLKTWLSGLQLGDLLAEVQERLKLIAEGRTRLDGLLEAFLAISSDLDLQATLAQIVRSAAGLLDARYAAIGVLGAGEAVAEFVQVGVDPETERLIGVRPTGHGLVGLLAEEPGPLRLADLTMHPASVGFPPHHPEMHTFLGVPIRVRGELYGNLYLTEKSGGAEFTEDDELLVQALAVAAGSAIENARMYERGRVRQRLLEAGAEIRIAMLSGQPTNEAMMLVAQRARELSDSDGTLILVRGTDDAFTVRIQVGGDPGCVGATADFSSAATSGEMTSGTPHLIDDLAGTFVGELAGKLSGAGPALAVPMRAGETVTGWLISYRRSTARRYQPDQVPILGSFAEQAGLAISLGEQQRARRILAVVTDRERIARDLHDHVIQRLFATGMSLQSTASRTIDAATRTRVQASVAEIDAAIKDLRTSIYDLHNADELSSASLRRRLADIVSAASAPSGPVPALRFEGTIDNLVTPQLAPDVEAAVREGLANAIRHSGAKSIAVSVVAGDDLTVTVTDDGKGIAPDAARSGLVNLAQRAARHGGTLHALPGAERGTVLRWQVPLDEA